MENTSIKLFESKKIRTHWDDTEEQWYFSVIDVVQTLTDSSVPKRYWSDLKKKLLQEGNEVYDFIVRLKMTAEDGKMRETDVADVQTFSALSNPFLRPKRNLSSNGWQKLVTNVSRNCKTRRKALTAPVKIGSGWAEAENGYSNG